MAYRLGGKKGQHFPLPRLRKNYHFAPETGTVFDEKYWVFRQNFKKKKVFFSKKTLIFSEKNRGFFWKKTMLTMEQKPSFLKEKTTKSMEFRPHFFRKKSRFFLEKILNFWKQKQLLFQSFAAGSCLPAVSPVGIRSEISRNLKLIRTETGQPRKSELLSRSSGVGQQAAQAWPGPSQPPPTGRAGRDEAISGCPPEDPRLDPAGRIGLRPTLDLLCFAWKCLLGCS